MTTAPLLVAALVLAPTPSVGAGGEDPAHEAPFAQCAAIANAGDCARAIEASHQDPAVLSRFRRRGESLTVLAQGRSFAFRDGENSDGDVRYSYIAYLRTPGLHVLRRQYGEGHEYSVLGDRDRQPHVVPGFPIRSPSRTRFVSYSESGESGYNADALEIWRVSGGILRREARLEPRFSQCPVSKVEWLSESEVRLTGTTGTSGTSGPAGATPGTCRMSVGLSGGRWVVR